MKAKDLTVGMECYYHERNSWEGDYQVGHRAVIVDPVTGNWCKQRDGSWARVSPYGQEVLVDIYHNRPDEIGYKEGSKQRRAVRTQTLRGLWEECCQLHTQTRAANAEAEAARQDALRISTARCQQVIELLHELEIPARVTWDRNGTREITISDAAAPLLAAAAAHLIDIGWYTPKLVQPSE